MKERPILFNGSMVRATLDGRKTQTRRIIKPQPHASNGLVNAAYCGRPNSWLPTGSFSHENQSREYQCHQGIVGDQLWVKETWQGFRQTSIEYDEWEEMESPKDRHVQFYEPVYRADNKNFPEKWQPSIFMPREYSRIQLEITGVRPERLQDISEADAVREGALVCSTGLPPGTPPVYGFDTDAGDFDENLAAYNARDAFAGLWRSLNTKRGSTWEENPWVWVIDFERIKP